VGIDPSQLATGAAMWMCLVALLSFHEYGHAWAAHKCGDDTAHIMGRMTINPIVHIDPIGTVLIPWVMILFMATNTEFGFAIFGWAKPVPVNPSNYGNLKRDDILVSMAGPAMNVILAFVILGLYRLGLALGDWPDASVIHQMPMIAFLSMILCVFNLIPIPPLDGSHVMRHVIGMSEETYMRIAQYGFIILIVVINFFPQVFGLVIGISIGMIQLFQSILLF
jgi:Zn-dependent protease